MKYFIKFLSLVTMVFILDDGGRAAPLNKGIKNCLAQLKKREGTNDKITIVRYKYAKGFITYKHKNFYLIHLLSIKRGHKTREHLYFLSKDSKLLPYYCKEALHIKIPVKKMVSLSTTHIAAIDMLGKIDVLKGVGNINLISNINVRKKAGQLVEVGHPPNPELLLKLNPDLIMAYMTDSPKMEGLTKLQQLRLPLVYNSDYLEKGPLARAEWIKFIGLFLNEEKKANDIFLKIESNYNRLKKLVAKKKGGRPVVLVGENKHGIWYSPGGKSDFARLLKDASVKYYQESDDSSRFITFPIEMIINKKDEFDFWLPQNGWGRLQEVNMSDNRYGLFKAYKNRRIYNNNKTVANAGKRNGNDYWETAMARPDLLLSDLIKIFHPELLPMYKLNWYRRLGP